MEIEFLLNGRLVRAKGFTPQTTLLDFVRAHGLTGAKEGCAEGECGACTVAMVKQSGYVAVNSCLLFLPMIAGQEIYTVEALAESGRLSEVQQALVDRGGSQCGYCTPGFVMSLFAEQYRPGREGACDLHAMGGNLCRCTGYRPIGDAARAVGAAPHDAFRERLSRPAPAMAAVACEGFARPGTLADCWRLIEEHPDARLIAGGTDLAVESNLRLKRFPYLIGLEALEELRAFRESASEVEIGAGLTLSEIGQAWRPALLEEWLPLFASPLIRNRATRTSMVPLGCGTEPETNFSLPRLGRTTTRVNPGAAESTPSTVRKISIFGLALHAWQSEREGAPGRSTFSANVVRPLAIIVRQSSNCSR